MQSTQRLARNRFTPEQRHQIVQRYRQSGMTQAQFVIHEGISKAALGRWLLQERRGAKVKAPKARFQEVVLPGRSAGWMLELVSPQNWTVRLAQVPPAANLSQLLNCLPC